jgi:hypothetical protein
MKPSIAASAAIDFVFDDRKATTIPLAASVASAAGHLCSNGVPGKWLPQDEKFTGPDSVRSSSHHWRDAPSGSVSKRVRYGPILALYAKKSRRLSS